MLYAKNIKYFSQEDLQSIQNLSIFGSQNDFFFSISLKISRKSISNFISFVLSIFHPEMVLRQFLSPMGLFRAQVLYIHEVMHVVVIRINNDLIFTSFQIIVPGFKSFNNYQKLVIMALILVFTGIIFLEKKTTGYYQPKLSKVGGLRTPLIA